MSGPIAKPQLIAVILFFVLAADAPAAKRRAYRGTSCSEGRIADSSWTQDVATDGRFVFFADAEAGRVYRVPSLGGERILIAEVPGLLVGSIVTDGSFVFFSAANRASSRFTLMRADVAGGNLVPLLDPPRIEMLALDGEWVYLTNPGTASPFMANGTVERVRKDGSAHEIIASRLALPLVIALDGSDVYFTEFLSPIDFLPGGVRRVPVAGGPIVNVIDLYFPGGMTVDQLNVYVSGRLQRTFDASLLRVPKAGGTWEALLGDSSNDSNFFNAPVLVHAGTRLYFTFSNPVTGGIALDSLDLITRTRTQLRASGVSQTIHLPTDSCRIYFAGRESIERLRLNR